jgi:hypothetical protein
MNRKETPPAALRRNAQALEPRATSKIEPTTPPLTSDERERLEQCDRIIAAGLHSSFEVGQALAIVHDEGLYREDYRTFEIYCRKRWQMGRAHAYRLIDAAKVAGQLLCLTNIPPPICERQIRPLVGLEAQKIAKAWAMAVSFAGGQPVRSCHVNAAITELRGTAQAAAEVISESPTATQLHELLRRQLRRLGQFLHADDLDSMLEAIEHMKLLIERYGSPADQPSEAVA